jgi:hypothetical protein
VISFFIILWFVLLVVFTFWLDGLYAEYDGWKQDAVFYTRRDALIELRNQVQARLDKANPRLPFARNLRKLIAFIDTRILNAREH